MAESISDDGQQQVTSTIEDTGHVPVIRKGVFDSPLSPVSSEDLDFLSPKGNINGNPGNRSDTTIEMESGLDVSQTSSRTKSPMEGGQISFTSSTGSPRRSKTVRTDADIMKLSIMSGDGYTDSISSSRPASAASSRSPYKEKAAERIIKEKEKEERFRLARQRMAEERQRKLVELKEQQRIAEQNRERQLELRRKKIEELRKRDEERRAAVEERRLLREATERSKREAIIQKASERMTRYEAWKHGGRKGGSGYVSGFGSRTPRGICTPSDRPKRSSSHSALMRHSPNSSDYGYISPQRRAISACSSVRRHCCVDINRTEPSPASPPQRPKSTVALNTTGTSSSTIKLRDNRSPRKPRPASVASSMPSFMGHETPRTSQRSVSTDRLNKEKRQKKKEEIKEVSEEKKTKKSSVSFSRQSIDRLSTPRQRDPMTSSIELPKKDPIIKSLPGNVKVSKEPQVRSPRTTEIDDKKIAVVKPSPSVVNKANILPNKPAFTPPTKVQSTPKVHFTPEVETPKDDQKDVEEYKAKMAEHRRLAREKAEREAEEERQRLEMERLKEEERLRQEEEEQRKLEEETLRLAEEARRIEEERLQKAIEAETKRREEEALKLEEERKAKELADQKAQEEAEKQERERLERAKKEEEERVERKKRLEMIMKRVKTDGPTETAKPESSVRIMTSSPNKSLESLDDIDKKSQSSEDLSKPMNGDTSLSNSQLHTPDKTADSGDKPRFRSPLLQQMAENKSDSPNSDRPKFKSPLLQNLLGKNKGGARAGLEKSSDELRAGDILNALKQKETLSFSSSQSLTDLSQASDSLSNKESLEKNMSKSVFQLNMNDEDKDIDTAENSSLNDADMRSEKTEHEKQDIHNGSISETTVHEENGIGGTEEDICLIGGADSGVIMDLGESGSSLQSIPVNGNVQHDLIYSSISLHSVDSNVSENKDIKTSSESNEFEELIDISVPSKSLEASSDLLNFNKIDETGDSEKKSPFIAFEDTSNNKQDVPDLLS